MSCRDSLVILFVAALCALGTPSLADVRAWDGGGGSTDWFDPNNWDANGIPAASDILTVQSGSPSTIVDVHSSDGGSITLDGSPTSASFATLHVGYSGSAALSILNDADLSSTYGHVGSALGSAGTVTVDGNGSTWENRQTLYVGYGRTGMLDISGGGAIPGPGTLVLLALGGMAILRRRTR
jgi:T5SS/PEP-CTERM-associated repeat protein